MFTIDQLIDWLVSAGCPEPDRHVLELERVAQAGRKAMPFCLGRGEA